MAALVTWPLLPRAAEALPDAGDPAESIWTLHWIAHAVFHDPAHLYAAPIFHGFPTALAYDDTSLLPGLLLAPLWLMANHLLFYNLLMWASLAAIGWTAYLLIHAESGSAAAGLIGGLVAAVNSYTLAHLSHLNVLSAYLLPLGLLALRHLFHPGPGGPGWRAALALAAVLIGQLLSTFYILAYLAIAAAAYVAWQVGVRRAVWPWPAAWRRRLVAQGLLVALVVAGSAALVLAPYLATQRTLGFTRTGEENAAWAARPGDYFRVSLHNRTYASLLAHNEAEPLFPGYLALGLAGLGMVSALRRRGRPRDGAAGGAPAADAGFYALLLALGVLLTLGPTLVVGGVPIPLPYRLLALLPGADALRAPVRAMVLVNLALGLFAGLGTRALLRALIPARPASMPAGDELARPAVPPFLAARWGGALGGLLAGLLLVSLGTVILVEQQVAPLGLTRVPATEAALPAVYRWLAGHSDGGVLIEMPVGLGLRDPAVESTRMLYQTWHAHPLVNGYSSFRPPTYVEILTTIDAQYSDFTAMQLGLLQSLDVQYIVYHRADYKAGAWAHLRAALRRFPQVHEIGVFPAAGFGTDHLYALDRRPAGAGLVVAVAPDAAHPGTVTIQIDNRYTYPLLSRLRPTLDLAAGGRRLAVATPLLIPPGRQTFTATLPGPPVPPATAFVPLAPAPAYLAVAATPAR